MQAHCQAEARETAGNPSVIPSRESLFSAMAVFHFFASSKTTATSNMEKFLLES
jgi:hypothetical protein